MTLKDSDFHKGVLMSNDDCTTNPLRQSDPDNGQRPLGCSGTPHFQAGTSSLSMAYCKRSQFFQNMVKKHTPSRVANT